MAGRDGCGMSWKTVDVELGGDVLSHGVLTEIVDAVTEFCDPVRTRYYQVVARDGSLWLRFQAKVGGDDISGYAVHRHLSEGWSGRRSKGLLRKLGRLV